MEPSWPPLVPTWLRTLLTLLSPQGHCPGWARGVFLPTPCPVYLLLLQTQQGGVASSVESAQPRRGHEDTLFSLLPYRDCKEIIKCATSPCLLTAFVSQGKTYPPLPGAAPCPPPTTVCTYATFLLLFPTSLPLRTPSNPGSPVFSLVSPGSPQGHRCAQSEWSPKLPSRKEVTQEWQPPWKACQHSRCCHTSSPAGVLNPRQLYGHWPVRSLATQREVSGR